MDTLNVSLTPPMVSVAFVVVELELEEVCLTVTVSPLLAVPTDEVCGPPLIEYVPPVIEVSAGVLIPETVIVLDVTTVLTEMPVWSLKMNGSGVLSFGK